MERKPSCRRPGKELRSSGRRPRRFREDLVGGRIQMNNKVNTKESTQNSRIFVRNGIRTGQFSFQLSSNFYFIFLLILH